MCCLERVEFPKHSGSYRLVAGTPVHKVYKLVRKSGTRLQLLLAEGLTLHIGNKVLRQQCANNVAAGSSTS